MGLYSTTYKYAQNHPEEFWSEAAEQLVWQRRWDKVLDDNNSPFTKWFSGGKINTCYNVLDVHVVAGRGEQAAIIYDSPVTETKEIPKVKIHQKFDEQTSNESDSSRIQTNFKNKLFKTKINRNVRLAEAPDDGKPAIMYDVNCSGAKDYMKLALEIINEKK